MNSLPANPPGPASPNQGARRETAREREQHLELAVRSAGIGIWTWDLGSDRLLLDARAHALLGLEEGAFSGKYEDFLALVHPEDRERVRQEIGVAMRVCSACDMEYRVVWPGDASVHALRTRGKFHGDEKGKASSMAGACWDVTGRRRVEAELARERQLLNCLMANLPDKIYFKDTESRFVCVNHAKLAKHDLTSMAEILGKTDFDLFSPDRAQRAFDDEKVTGEPLVDQEEKDVWPDGSETWVSTTKMPLRDAEGRIVGTFGLSRDVTARKRAEEQLAIYAEDLRRKNAELQQDLEMARELQTAMLPQQYPLFPRHASPQQTALRFSHFFNPTSEVSGDFFDILQLSDTLAGIFICDVMGHGVRAALVAAIVRTLVEEMRGEAEMPGEFLERVNRALREVLKPMQTPIFVSAFFAVADLAKGELRYANAGHPNPLCVRHEPDAGSVFALNAGKHGPALGLFDHATYETSATRLAEHDVVMLFTDGLFEVENAEGELYDQARLRHAVEGRLAMSAEGLCADLVREIQQFSGSKDFTDDVCLVTMEVDRLGIAAEQE